VLERGAEAGDVLDAVLAESGAQRKALWRLREIAAGGHQFQEGALIKHDVSVPVSRVPALIARATAAAEAAWPGVRVIAFGHVGDGNVHFNLVQPTGEDGVAFGAARAMLNRVVHDIVDALGGSVSAEHGIGLLKIDEMARYKSDVELDLMRAVKQAFDPRGLMNPGKVLPERT
jgi:D-lactate dehydrogenase (cytochrome)